jgi:hypothetical protein
VITISGDNFPVCHCCGEPIKDNLCYKAAGHLYCQKCELAAWERIKREYWEVVLHGPGEEKQ